MQVLLFEDEYPQFMIETVQLTEYFVEFNVYAVESGDLHDHGMVKWDGCAHLYFGDSKDTPGGIPGYLHLCEKHDIELHAKMMLALYEWATSKIVAYDPAAIDVAESWG